jgi:RNA polymerase sigma-70 factor, ECF subfamily
MPAARAARTVVSVLDRPARPWSRFRVVASPASTGDGTPREATDEQLLVAVGGGDREAFTLLWRRLAGAVLAVARRTVGDTAAAEDTTQEVFATIWRAAATFDPARGTAAAWIFTITRNAARDGARRRRIATISDAPETIDPGRGPEEQTAAMLDGFRVHTALAALPPRWREVLELAYFDGLSQVEIAQRTGAPLGTIKTRTRAALAQLATTLGDDVR